jgi:DNA-binding response OmpR family regulator
MPVSDGLDLCRRIRHLGDSYVYFILVSSQLDNPEKQLEAVHCGVDDLAIKPLMPADLKARMRVAERVYRITHRLQRRGVWENLRETRSMSEGDAKQDNLSLHACKYCGLHSRSVGRMLRAFCPHCRKRALMQKIFDCRADQSLGWNQSLRYG